MCTLCCLGVLDSLRSHGLQPTCLLCLWDFSGKILECVAMSYSRVFSQPRDWTRISCISCIGRGFFTTEPLAAAAAKSLQWCPTLRDPIGGSPPGSAIPGILQARTLEWVAISFSNKWKWSRSVVSDSSRPHGLQPTRLLCPWEFPGKSTGVGGHCLLELSHLGSP